MEVFANQIDGWIMVDDVGLSELILGDDVERSIYSLAGQSVAVRNVRFDASGALISDELRYVLSDHLGSHSAFTDENGNLLDINGVGGANYRDIVLYEPFGAYRNNARPDDITGRSYTGHQDNEDIGLVYMNARYFVPYLNRFASADTLVPAPNNPQSFNRFSYVNNNPVKYTDPTGHFSEDAIREYLWDRCEGDETCFSDTFNQWRGDEEWWQMLRTAQQGDLLLVGGGFVGERYVKFHGTGNIELTGVSFSDGDGNSLGDIDDVNIVHEDLKEPAFWMIALIRWRNETPSIPWIHSDYSLTQYTNGRFAGLQDTIWAATGGAISWAATEGISSIINRLAISVGTSVGFDTVSYPEWFRDITGTQPNDVTLRFTCSSCGIFSGRRTHNITVRQGVSDTGAGWKILTPDWYCNC